MNWHEIPFCRCGTHKGIITTIHEGFLEGNIHTRDRAKNQCKGNPQCIGIVENTQWFDHKAFDLVSHCDFTFKGLLSDAWRKTCWKKIDSSSI